MRDAPIHNRQTAGITLYALRAGIFEPLPDLSTSDVNTIAQRAILKVELFARCGKQERIGHITVGHDPAVVDQQLSHGMHDARFFGLDNAAQKMHWQ